MEQIDMGKLMEILSKVDKKDLEKSIAKANEIMNSKDKEQIIKDLSDTIKIHRDGSISSNAPEFGQIMKIQVLEIAREGDGSEHEIQINW